MKNRFERIEEFVDSLEREALTKDQQSVLLVSAKGFTTGSGSNNCQCQGNNCQCGPTGSDNCQC